MNNSELTAFIANYSKGTFVSMETERAGKVYAKHKNLNITKTQSMVVRLGVDYENLGQTAKNRASGASPEENAGLPWGEWEMFPFLIGHKGKQYVRVYANKDQIKAQWFLNGVPVMKSIIEPFLTSAETSNDKLQYAPDGILTFTVTGENIKSIGKVGEVGEVNEIDSIRATINKVRKVQEMLKSIV